MLAAVHPRPLVSPSSRDLCGRRLPGLPRASREPGRDVSALDCSFSFTLSNLHLSTFDFQTCSNSFPYLVTSLLASSFLSPLSATLIDLPASVANKRLTPWLSPLDATLTKNRGPHLPASFSDVQDLQTFRRVSDLSPLLSHPCALFPRSVAQQLQTTPLISSSSALFAVATGVCQHRFSVAPRFTAVQNRPIASRIQRA